MDEKQKLVKTALAATIGTLGGLFGLMGVFLAAHIVGEVGQTPTLALLSGDWQWLYASAGMLLFGIGLCLLGWLLVRK